QSVAISAKTSDRRVRSRARLKSPPPAAATKKSWPHYRPPGYFQIRARRGPRATLADPKFRPRSAAREPQKSTGGGPKCSQLFPVGHEGGGERTGRKASARPKKVGAFCPPAPPSRRRSPTRYREFALDRKKLAAFSALGPPRTGEGRKRAKERGVRFGR